MSQPAPTVGELFKAKAVTDEQVNAAVETYLADPGADAHPIADGYSLDLAAAVAGHRWASEVVANPESSPGLKRGAVRTAILPVGWRRFDASTTPCGLNKNVLFY